MTWCDENINIFFAVVKLFLSRFNLKVGFCVYCRLRNWKKLTQLKWKSWMIWMRVWQVWEKKTHRSEPVCRRCKHWSRNWNRMLTYNLLYLMSFCLSVYSCVVKWLWLCLWELWHSVDSGVPQLPQTKSVFLANTHVVLWNLL